MKSFRPAGRVLALLAVAAMVVCAWLGPLEAAANRQIDAGLKRALVSFAVARTLNAVISVAQGTAVSLQPLGVGVTLTLGQVLEPVHDVVEQFSGLMLAASVAFGVQKVLVAVGSHWMVSVLLTAVAAWWAVLFIRRRSAPQLVAQALVVLLMLRFALPVATIGSDLVFQQFLAHDYVASQQALDRTAVQVDKAGPAATAAAQNQSFGDRIAAWAGAQGTAWRERFDSLKQAAEQATEHVIKLMVIFILQTLVLPFVLLWGLYALARAMLRHVRAPIRPA